MAMHGRITPPNHFEFNVIDEDQRQIEFFYGGNSKRFELRIRRSFVSPKTTGKKIS